MKLYLIRHGETVWNKEKKLQGTTDIPLSDLGISQAKEKAKSLTSVAFDLIYSSPLKRAYETAKLIRQERPIPIIKEERIREISFGTYEGMIHKGEFYNIPDPDFPLFFSAPDHYHTPPLGESITALLDRTENFLEELSLNPALQDKTILISAHGAAVRAILSNIEQCPLSQFWGNGVHKNCGVSCIQYENGKWEKIFENQ